MAEGEGPFRSVKPAEKPQKKPLSTEEIFGEIGAKFDSLIKPEAAKKTDPVIAKIMDDAKKAGEIFERIGQRPSDIKTISRIERIKKQQQERAKFIKEEQERKKQ